MINDRKFTMTGEPDDNLPEHAKSLIHLGKNRGLNLARYEELGSIAKWQIERERGRRAVEAHREVAEVAGKLAVYGAETRAVIIKTRMDMACEAEVSVMGEKRIQDGAAREIRLMEMSHQASSEAYNRFRACKAQIEASDWPPDQKRRRIAALEEKLRSCETLIDEDLHKRHRTG